MRIEVRLIHSDEPMVICEEENCTEDAEFIFISDGIELRKRALCPEDLKLIVQDYMEQIH